MLANPNLVPSFDMLGLPMPAWLAQFLMALTLALHWLFLAMTLGGAVAYVRAGRGGPAPSRKSMAAFLPLSLTTAMTLGIAPLLFVQVLYGQFFYTANILMGYVWLGLLGVMIVNFYLLYYAWRRVRDGCGVRAVGLAVLVLLAVSAVILTANATLAQSPWAWEGFRAAGGVKPYHGDPAFLPRWLAALSVLLAGGGLFVGIFPRIAAAVSDAEPSQPSGGADALGVSLVGLVGAIAFGIWGLLALPSAQRAAVLTSFESVFTYLAAAGLVATGVLALRARQAPSIKNLLPPGLTYFVSLLAIAFARDTLRRAAIADHFTLADVPVHAQWTSFTLFAVVFVLGLALMAYLVKLAYTTAPSNADNPGARTI